MYQIHYTDQIIRHANIIACHLARCYGDQLLKVKITFSKTLTFFEQKQSDNYLL